VTSVKVQCTFATVTSNTANVNELLTNCSWMCLDPGVEVY